MKTLGGKMSEDKTPFGEGDKVQDLKTINIKGKPYVMVNERVIYFRNNYPGYGLEIDWVQIDNEIAICKAVIKDPEGKIKSTGTAFERAGSTFINKTSHIENAETSAVGRALGFMNIGINTSIASADEVENAIKNQDVKIQADAKPDHKKSDFVRAISMLLNKIPLLDFEKLVSSYGVLTYKKITDRDTQVKFFKELQEKVEEQSKKADDLPFEKPE